MKTYILETENLTKTYGKTTVVNSVNLKIPKGKIYGLLGKNGAGKTTTMCLILNLVNKTSGNIYLFGQNIVNPTDSVYKNIGSIIETPGFYKDLTGEENLRLFSKLSGINNKKNINAVLDMVSLTQQKDKLFKNYSLGMKQRLAIALALLKSPDLLILDEPINGLDPIGIQEIRTILRNLADEFGRTILISSHILSEIEHIADIIGIMNGGVLVEEISMSNLEDKMNRYVNFQVDNIEITKNIFEDIGLIENEDYLINDNGDINLLSHLELRGNLNKILVDSGVTVYTINLVKQNLEEYFTDLIGGGLDD